MFFLYIFAKECRQHFLNIKLFASAVFYIMLNQHTIIAYEKTYTFISALHFMYITRNG